MIQVLGHSLPGDAQGGLVAVDVAGRQLHALHRCAAVSAVSDDLQGHPLADGADRPRIHHQGIVGVAVDIDEAGRDVEAGGVDPGDIGDGSEVPDVRDSALRDGHVAGSRRGAGPVQNGSVGDDQFGWHCGLRRRLEDGSHFEQG